MTWRWRMIRLTRVIMLWRRVVWPSIIGFFWTTKFWSIVITVVTSHRVSIVWFKMVAIV